MNDRQQQLQVDRKSKRLIRTLVLVIAGLVVLVLFLLAPRYRRQIITVDDAHRWSSAEAPPRRQIIWQPASRLSIEAEFLAGGDGIRPMIADHGDTLYLTIRSQDGHCDIFRSHRQGDRWSEPQPVIELNSSANDIGPIVRADGKVLYLYSDRDGGFGGMDLYVSRRQGDRWSQPKNLGPRINGPAHEYDPAVSPDGSQLFFASNRSESIHRQMAEGQHRQAAQHWNATLRTDLGNRTFDLYVAKSDSKTGQWNHALPMAPLNTADHNEGSPYVSDDGVFLLFSSDRPTQPGEPKNYDIYRTRLDQQPLAAVNLGSGVNSAAHEIEPTLGGSGFQIVFSRSVGDGANRYELYQSTAKEIYHDRSWDSSRWKALTAAVASIGRRFLDHIWWLAAILVLLAALYWLLRNVTLRPAALPGFLLAALLIHLLLVTSSFFVYFQEEISNRLRELFDQETVIASEVLLKSTAETVDQQSSFQQVADLDIPDPAEQTQVAKQPTATHSPVPENMQLVTPASSARLSRDRPSDAVVANVPYEPSVDKPNPSPVQRRRPTTQVTPERVLLEKTVAVDTPATKPLQEIAVTLPNQSIDEVSPAIDPAGPKQNQQPSLSPGEKSTATEPIVVAPAPAPLSLDRSAAPRSNLDRQQEEITTETIAESDSQAADELKHTVADAPLPKEMADPAIANPQPIVIAAKNHSALRSDPQETLQPITTIATDRLASRRQMPNVPLQRSRPVPQGANATSELAELKVPQNHADSHGDHPIPRSSPVHVARQASEEVSVELRVVAAENSKDSAAANRSTDRLEGLVAVPIPSRAASGKLPKRQSLRASDAYADTNVNLRSLLQRRKLDAATKANVIKQFGGTDQTLAAIRRGLTWIEQHQHSDGHWGLHNFHENCRGHKRCSGKGNSKSDTAGTGLALLPFLGDGNTHRQGPYKDLVGRGITWLIEHQKPNGDLFTGGQDIAWMYSHAIGTIALCECYGMSGDAALRGPAQRAIDFIVAAQDPKTGGWRYRPRDNSDTSVVGWQVMALKSGQMAELNVPAKSFQEARRWLESVAGKGGRKGQFGYQRGRFNPAMSAEGLLCLEYIGATRDEQPLRDGAEFLKANVPKKNRETSYFWYYGTQAMFHLQGEHWKSWNDALHPLLIESQRKDGPMIGTWDPRDNWERSGGRIYSTSLRLLMLEVYYRHLPLYQVID